MASTRCIHLNHARATPLIIPSHNSLSNRSISILSTSTSTLHIHPHPNHQLHFNSYQIQKNHIRSLSSSAIPGSYSLLTTTRSRFSTSNTEPEKILPSIYSSSRSFFNLPGLPGLPGLSSSPNSQELKHRERKLLR
jgi:hypothetical protein